MATKKKRKTHFGYIAPSVEAYWWLKDCKTLTAEDHALCKRWLLKVEEKLSSQWSIIRREHIKTGVKLETAIIDLTTPLLWSLLVLLALLALIKTP